MRSMFDDPEFNGRLFFPQRVESRCPPDAIDLRASVKGATLHLRWHHAVPDAPTVLLFHGNGETVADYDHAAPSYARHGMNLAVVDYRGYGRSVDPGVRAQVSPLRRCLPHRGQSFGRQGRDPRVQPVRGAVYALGRQPVQLAYGQSRQHPEHATVLPEVLQPRHVRGRPSHQLRGRSHAAEDPRQEGAEDGS